MQHRDFDRRPNIGPTGIRLAVAGFALLFVIVSSHQPAFGQAGLRESLERLDRNENGEIESEEITPLSRPYLERVARARRMSMDRDYEIERWLEAAQFYYSQQNGVDDRRVSPEGESTVREFGTLPGKPLVPEFGLAEVKYPYTQDDLDFADRTMRSHDHNRDGYIDRREAEYEKWTHRNPFADDLNKDERLSRLELAQRYARRRLLDDAADEFRKKNWRVGGEAWRRNEERDDDDDRRDDSQWWRRGGNRYYLTATIMSRFDSNRNGRLELQEVSSLGIPAGRVDADRNGELSREELHAYLTELQDEIGDLADGLPGWFFELDANRDQQVAMSEFTDDWTDEKLAEFTSLDFNGDGLLTAAEILRSKAMVGGTYSNNEAQVLPPKKTIISEIIVNEDYNIGDLNVRLSLTHTHTSHLDAFLTGPDGQRVELFTEVGGHDDHFDQTVFDDQSRFPITKARPPFKGTFLPEAVVKRQPGLSQFNGKSVEGVWQLVIRGTRSDRFGMLHSWGLIVRPEEEMIGEEASPSPLDGPQESNIPDGSAFRPPPRPEMAKSSPAPKPNYDEAIRVRASEDAKRVYREVLQARGIKESSSGDLSDEQRAAMKEARKQAMEKYKEYFNNKGKKDGYSRKGDR